MTNASPEFLAANRDLIDDLTKIADTDEIAANLLSDIHGYGSITARQIRLGWYRIKRAARA